MVEKAKHHIREGDIFQIVLSNRLSAPFEGSLLNTYRVLRTINPSPYMFYFSGTDVEVAGASPETLVKLENGVLHTFPLAGTRPRGKTEEEDKALEAELLVDEKELAEHNMLVDLGRNDLGKISKFGTVQVERLHSIERFSHVMHIGSTVRGEISENHDALDAIEAVLPAGTLSGAPKIRACQLIGALENSKRGIYGGAIGYIDFTGNMDTCIAIRIAYKKNGKVFVRSGAGIVADSVVKGLLPDYDLVGVYSRTASKAAHIVHKMQQHGKHCIACATLEELLALKPDYLVESASPAAMRGLALPALRNGTSVITLSIGALADETFYQEVTETAKANGTRIYIASGATGGFDVLRTASLMGNTTARFFNEKGPNGLKGTPVYDDSLQTEQRTVFSGSAAEAIRLFPTKVNVTVAASRASVGPENMQVSIQSTPGFVGDTQRVEIKNDQVHAVVDIYSATSDIAGWSVVSTLINITSPIVF